MRDAYACLVRLQALWPSCSVVKFTVKLSNGGYDFCVNSTCKVFITTVHTIVAY